MTSLLAWGSVKRVAHSQVWGYLFLHREKRVEQWLDFVLHAGANGKGDPEPGRRVAGSDGGASGTDSDQEYRISVLIEHSP